MNKKNFYTSPLLKSFKHGFFTRNGGYSSGLYSSLNCGLSSLDKRRNVINNRNEVAKTLKFNVQNLFIGDQYHSNKVVIVNDAENRVKCDGIISTSTNITLGVLTADCCPILVGHQDNLIVGTIHLGWKGLLNGILENFLNKIDDINVKRSDLIFALGPSIGKLSYEVGLEFKMKFKNKDIKSSAFFNNKNNNIFFDLRGYAVSKLKELGILNIWVSKNDTYKEKTTFFSYRYAQNNNIKDYGRLLSVIKL